VVIFHTFGPKYNHFSHVQSRFSMMPIFVGAIAILIIGLYFYLQKSFRSKGEISTAPPLPEKAKSAHIPIKPLEYHRFIAVEQTNKECILRMLKSMAALARKETPEQLEKIAHPEEFEIRNFGFARQGEWLILKIDPATEFYFYHNLVAWFDGCDSGIDCPDKVIGLARHINESAKDYVFFMDPANAYGDAVVGAFREGPPFSVYLPEAYDTDGNMKSKPNLILTFDRVMRPYRADGVNELVWDTLNFEKEEVRWYE
jgi:hypothetical protein